MLKKIVFFALLANFVLADGGSDTASAPAPTQAVVAHGDKEHKKDGEAKAPHKDEKKKPVKKK